MEVFEKSETVDPEVRAYTYSLVSAVSQIKKPNFFQETDRRV